MTKEKPKQWRKLAPPLSEVSADKAAVLTLHHLELALAYFDCIDPVHTEAELQHDSLERMLSNNRLRLEFVKAELLRRYESEDLRAVALAFLQAANDHSDAMWRRDAEG